MVSATDAADLEQFEISFLSETGARLGIKTYERMGFEKVSVRRDDAGGKIWVTFREVKTKNPTS